MCYVLLLMFMVVASIYIYTFSLKGEAKSRQKGQHFIVDVNLVVILKVQIKKLTRIMTYS